MILGLLVVSAEAATESYTACPRPPRRYGLPVAGGTAGAGREAWGKGGGVAPLGGLECKRAVNQPEGARDCEVAVEPDLAVRRDVEERPDAEGRLDVPGDVRRPAGAKAEFQCCGAGRGLDAPIGRAHV